MSIAVGHKAPTHPQSTLSLSLELISLTGIVPALCVYKTLGNFGPNAAVFDRDCLTQTLTLTMTMGSESHPAADQRIMKNLASRLRRRSVSGGNDEADPCS